MHASTQGEVFAKFDVSVMGYEDDHVLYSSSCLNKATILSTIASIELCLKEVKGWMGRNRLIMKEENTEFVAS